MLILTTLSNLNFNFKSFFYLIKKIYLLILYIMDSTTIGIIICVLILLSISIGVGVGIKIAADKRAANEAAIEADQAAAAKISDKAKDVRIAAEKAAASAAADKAASAAADKAAADKAAADKAAADKIAALSAAIVNPEVYQIQGKYNQGQALSACQKFNGTLATNSQLTDSFNKGSQWCSWGWLADPLSSGYPMQDVNLPGCNDASFKKVYQNTSTDPNTQYSATCYGIKPVQGTDSILPFNKTQWKSS
jgi:hypothetical protein